MVTTQDYHLLTDAQRMMCEIKTKDLYEYFSKDKEIFDFSNCSTISKY